MISSSGWKTALPRKTEAAALNGHSRIAVVGIGNSLYSDDGVGSQIAQDLMARVPVHPNRLVVDGGTAPENFTGVIRRFGPEFVVFVDAADMGIEAGKIALLNWHQTSGIGASTHAFPVYMLASYLELELGCQVLLIGVQPKNIAFGLSSTEPVKQAAGELVDELAALLLGNKEMKLCRKS